MPEGISYNPDKRPAHGDSDPDDVGPTLPPFSERFHGRLVFTPEGTPLSVRETPRFVDRPDGTDVYPDDEKVPIESGLEGLYAYIHDSFPEDEAKEIFLDLDNIVNGCGVTSDEAAGKDTSGTEPVRENIPVGETGHGEASRERLRGFLEKHPELTRFFKAFLLVVSLTLSAAVKPETSFASNRDMMKQIQKEGADEYDRRTARFGVDRQLDAQDRFYDGVRESERRERDLTERGNQARRDFIGGVYRFVDDLKALENEYRLEFDREMTRSFPNDAARSVTKVEINRKYLLKVVELENRLKDLSSRVDSITSQSVFGPLTGGRIRRFMADKERMMQLALERSGSTRAKLGGALKKSGIEIPKNALDENDEPSFSTPKDYGSSSPKNRRAAETRNMTAETVRGSDAEFLDSLFRK